MSKDIWEIIFSDESAAVKEYLDGGGDANEADRDSGWSLLHQAAHLGSATIARMLCERGAEQTATKKEFWPEDEAVRAGTTPMKIAQKWDDQPMIDVLKEFQDGAAPAPAPALMGFHPDAVYAVVACGKVVGASHKNAAKILEYCLDYAKEQPRVMASPTGDLSEDYADGEPDYEVVVGIKVAVLEIPGDMFEQQGVGSSDYGLTEEFDQAAIERAMELAEKLPKAFWDKIAELSDDSDATEGEVAPLVTSCGPLCLARLETPGGESMEVSYEGTSYVSVPVEDGSYMLEGQYD